VIRCRRCHGTCSYLRTGGSRSCRDSSVGDSSCLKSSAEIREQSWRDLLLCHGVNRIHIPLLFELISRQQRRPHLPATGSLHLAPETRDRHLPLHHLRQAVPRSTNSRLYPLSTRTAHDRWEKGNLMDTGAFVGSAESGASEIRFGVQRSKRDYWNTSQLLSAVRWGT